MKKIWTSLKENQAFLFLLIILGIGLVIGIFFGLQQKEFLVQILPNYIESLKTEPLNLIVFHLGVVAILFITTFFLIGIPLFTGYFFFEGLSIGFISVGIYSLYGVPSLLFIVIFFLLTKLIYLGLLFFIFNKLLKIAKLIIRNITKKEQNKLEFYEIGKNTMILIAIIIINDLFIFTLGSKIIQMLFFLLK